jgi:hypothetical protein
MCQLNGWDRSYFFDKFRTASQRLYVAIVPNAHIFRANAAACLDGRSLDHDQGCSADSAAAEMNQMPVRRGTLHG